MSSFRNALAVYLLWVAATWLLEGLPRTLLRPEATGLRLAYASIANFGIGLLLSFWLIRRHLRAGWGTPGDYGLSPPRRWTGLAAGALIGYGLFHLGHPQPVAPIVLLNAFAQVWVVTAAEIVVCWALVGGTLRLSLKGRNAIFASGAAASVLFGLYHFAHSPPFNEVRMVAFLGAIGLATSAFWLVSRDLLGTAVFHNFLGVTGVLGALEAQGKAAPSAPDISLIMAAAVVTLALLWPVFRWRKEEKHA